MGDGSFVIDATSSFWTSKMSDSEKAPARQTRTLSRFAHGSQADRGRGSQADRAHGAAPSHGLSQSTAAAGSSLPGSRAGSGARGAPPDASPTAAPTRTRSPKSRLAHLQRLAQLREQASSSKLCCPLPVPTCLTDCSTCREAHGYVPPLTGPKRPYAASSDRASPCVPLRRLPKPGKAVLLKTSIAAPANFGRTGIGGSKSKRRKSSRLPKPPWVHPCPHAPTEEQLWMARQRQAARSAAANQARHAVAVSREGARAKERPTPPSLVSSSHAARKSESLASSSEKSQLSAQESFVGGGSIRSFSSSA